MKGYHNAAATPMTLPNRGRSRRLITILLSPTLFLMAHQAYLLRGLFPSLTIGEDPTRDAPQILDPIAGKPLQNATETVVTDVVGKFSPPVSSSLNQTQSTKAAVTNHPHAGALDIHGKPGYIHNATYVRSHPLKMSNLSTFCSVPRGRGEEGPHGYRALRKIKVHSIPANKTKRKVLCAVYTHSNRHHVVRAIAETWGPQCDGLFAASNVTDPSIGAVNLLHMGNETYGNMWQKIRSMWAYIYDHYLMDYDYFYICGDDTYVIPDNLRYSVSMLPSNPDKILYMGRKMGDFPRPRRAYCGGGAGYTLSRGAVRTLVGTLYPTKECHPNWTTPQEDRMVTQCFRSIRVHCMDDVDERDEPRYHIQDADFHAKWRYGRRTPMQIDSLIQHHNVKLKEGLESISESSIAFHLKGVPRRGGRLGYAPISCTCPRPV